MTKKYLSPVTINLRIVIDDEIRVYLPDGTYYVVFSDSQTPLCEVVRKAVITFRENLIKVVNSKLG